MSRNDKSANLSAGEKRIRDRILFVIEKPDVPSNRSAPTATEIFVPVEAIQDLFNGLKAKMPKR